MSTELPKGCGNQEILGRGECFWQPEMGDPIPAGLGRVVCQGCSAEVIESLEWEANHDLMTGALNRRGCIKKISELLAQGQTPGLLESDLDNVKKVNDLLGYDVGDEMILEYIEALNSGKRTEEDFAVNLKEYTEEDHAIRFGGDEFGLLTVVTKRRPESLDTPRKRLIRTGFHFRDLFVNRKRVKEVNKQLKHFEGSPQLDVKFGIAVYDPTYGKLPEVIMNRMIFEADPKNRRIPPSAREELQ